MPRLWIIDSGEETFPEMRTDLPIIRNLTANSKRMAISPRESYPQAHPSQRSPPPYGAETTPGFATPATASPVK